MMPETNDDERRKVLGDAEEAGLDSFLESVLAEALQAVGATQGSLMLLNTREGVLEINKRRGPLYDPKRKHRRFSVGEGIAGWVAEHCEPYCTADVTQESGFKKPRGELNFRSLLAVPILREDRAIGVICADSPELGKFNQSHEETLNRLAQDAGAAIRRLAVDTFINHTKRLKQLESLHEVGQELSRLTFESPEQLSTLLKQIAKDAERVLEADLVTLYQYYEKNDRFETPPTLSGVFNHQDWMVTSIHPDDAPDRIVKMGRPHYSEAAQIDKIMRAGETVPAGEGLPQRPSFVDRESVKSSAGIPLRAGGETVGVMFINYRILHPFPEHEKHVIETFAAYAALAIQGARRFEEAMRLRKHEALQQTSRMVAHRLRNVLPVISDRIERALTRGKMTGEGHEWCRVALEETRRAQKIVRDFETFSRAEIFDRPDILSSSELVQKLGVVVKDNLTQPDAQVKVSHVYPDLAVVEVNFDRLSDDFAAFVRDSERHKPSGLDITISCEPADNASLHNAGLQSRGPYIKLSYMDNGPGVPVGSKQRIFEPFYTTTGGSGLGLAIAKHNSKVQDGILIECGQPGHGVHFELYLPLSGSPERSQYHEQ